MKKIERNKDAWVDEVHKWILDRKEYAAFTDRSDDGSSIPSCRLRWVKGHAGIRKTMLLIGIIRELSSQPAKLIPYVSYFFCQGINEALNSATATLRSLIWLLLVQQPHLISHLRSKYTNAGASLFGGESAFIALSTTFKSMLKDPNLSPVHFIVDALDELELSTPATTGCLVELATKKLKQPVNVYIEKKLSAFDGKPGYTKAVLDDISVEIRKRAGNTFLWVWFVFQELERTNKFGKLLLNGSDVLAAVKKIPPGLSEVYGRIMDMIDWAFFYAMRRK
ncbi:hypothetical protein C7999DRAFT_36232 [Corynascus novoguineensis]|uniref:Nephrocystin 3-like N-terminal domain-containing protein n=1 Tax=Corynascus novoguineensis TaxID=1126955 RepID=A0AAN7HB87_9PEZI|nr:hypothetical protein C7999DRAFT_36232 [Corynascus novoguineensis]